MKMLVPYLLFLFSLSPFINSSPLSDHPVHRVKRTADSAAPTAGSSAQGQNTVGVLGRPKFFSQKARTADGGTSFNIPNFSSLFTRFLPSKTDASDHDQQMAYMQEQCSSKYSGTLINGECYEFHLDSENKEDSQEDCNMRGGKLWTPDLNDLELFNKIMTAMPQAAGGPRERLWIDVFRSDGQFFDADGKNLTSAYLVNIDYNEKLPDSTSCITLVASFGAFYLYTPQNGCADTFSYICEYVLEPAAAQGGKHKYTLPTFLKSK